MKRVLSVLLAAAVFISCFQALTALAGDLTPVHYGETVSVNNTKMAEKSGTVYKRNTLLSVIDELSDYTYTENLDEARLYLRDCFLNRVGEGDLCFPYDESASNADGVRSIIYTARSCDYSSSTKDGDYMFYNSMYSCKWNWYNREVADGWMTLVHYTVDYRSTSEQESLVNEKISEIAPTLIGSTDYETIKNIHDYVCETVTYNYDLQGTDAKEKHLVYCALFDHKVVCGGYASLFYRLARELGFDVRVVNSAPIGHIWNIIKLGGKWYYVDCSRDDYDNAADCDITTVTVQDTRYTYFLKGSDDFNDHESPDDFKVGADQKDITEYGISNSSYSFNESCANEHNFEDYTFENKSCSELYCEVKKCADCGETKRSFVKSGAHTDETNGGIAPTCLESGVSQFSYCSTCYKTLESREYLAPLGHDTVEDVTPATFTESGVISSRCQRCGEEFGDKLIVPLEKAGIFPTQFYYDGKSQLPSVYVSDYEGYSIPANQYTITYPQNPVAPGTYSVRLDFCGNYAGSVTLKYKILLRKTYLKSYTASSNYIRLSLNRTPKLTGYQVRYATNKSFTKNVKRVKFKGNKNTIRKLKKLKPKTKYYIRIRTYKVIGDKTYYSKWSKTYKIKTDKK